MTSPTIVQQLADFAAGVDTARLPDIVVQECKRDILDSLGVALAGIDHPRGRIGVEMGSRIGGTAGDATIIGTGERTTVYGAAFANSELLNALDADSVLLPGHVSPYVLPGAFATAEVHRRSGKELIAAVAVSHEISYRFGAAMAGYRDTKDGKSANPASVVGYSSTVFGATASAGKLKRLSAVQLANALGLAAASAPVNAQRAWFMHAPTATIKYQLAGGLTNIALTVADMGELGHRGDLRILDDEVNGYASFIGTDRWTPELITADLGDTWRFPAFQMFKPYPHCRVMHAPLDLLIDIVTQHDLKPDEIESITSYGEGWAYVLPCFTNRDILEVHDAQFCFSHGLAVAAHRIPPGPRWQDPAVVFDASVMALMNRVSLKTHPTYFQSISADISSRPSRVEVRARGQVFAGEKMFPKGTPSADPSTYMTTDELVGKFRTFVDALLPAATVDRIVDSVLNLEHVDDFGTVIRQFVRAAGR
ncbi:2-methylcitrate dehydratase [Burkholderia stagnalis]|uniref:MmgE/PrpD family protein n=1 Tax=Burkholderia stagnalis TaxID=1503054 RepID=A0A6L3N5E6_9BURK|nr:MULTISPECIES: MmgE/PrpD family protein [Burkholderia cepacia complex]KAB0641629.1 MmgE/PrpD family protein [Burkholderia stagnalis]KVH73549.1 2-methylcitrate dehydratase [Burkholderia cepacia]KVO47791.1 2-methylcitrate dehydratase [Burkholderia stagnalis]KVO69955.1 2-methylcitrate dehydratase [Burkholderia stagnalis]KVW59258.1 2-methylcitrate dehydratase [Burkholderia stagnalis]